jgi:hypothetical protein
MQVVDPHATSLGERRLRPICEQRWSILVGRLRVPAPVLHGYTLMVRGPETHFEGQRCNLLRAAIQSKTAIGSTVSAIGTTGRTAAGMR